MSRRLQAETVPSENKVISYEVLSFKRGGAKMILTDNHLSAIYFVMSVTAS